MNKKPVFDLAPVDSEKKTIGVLEEDGNEGNESSNNNRDGPTQQNIKNLRRAQILYRDMKRTREDLKSRKERLDWEIRFGFTNGYKGGNYGVGEGTNICDTTTESTRRKQRYHTAEM